MIEDQKIAIIGGTGKFGRHMGEMLQEDNEILISGSSPESAAKVAEEYGWKSGRSQEIVADSDIVIFSAPISLTTDIIEKVAPEAPDDALLCDVTSVKEKPCKAMEKHGAEILGMHPMYAPSNPPRGQNVVLCPVRGKKWTMMEEFWIEKDANVHIATPEEHDKAMSVVQGLTHFTELVFAQTLSKIDHPEEKTEDFASPIYRIIRDLTGRMLNQQAELYSSIQTENSRNEEVRKLFQDSAEEIAEALDNDGFEDLFEQLGGNFHLELSQERSDELIESMRKN